MACLSNIMRTVSALPKKSYPVLNEHCCVIQVRWRKPRWKPVAKSKMFYVREPTPINEEEYKEITTRYNIYRTQMKTIRSFLHKWQSDMKTEDDSQEEVERAEAEEHQRVLQINRRWNEEVALQRQARQEEELLEKSSSIILQKQLQEEKELEMMEEAMKYIKYETEQSKTFVTEETLDDEIEKLLNTRKEYNFALDPEGNKVTVNADDKIKKQTEQTG